MAAFDGYDDWTKQQSAPGSSGGAFADYPPAAASSSASASSAGPSQSWSDYLLDHLHSFSQGLNAATRVATDAPTFGLMDKLFGSQAQADTASAYKQMGGAAVPLSLAGGMATGLPELKAASAIGEAAAPYVGKWAGGVLGSGAVGAGSGALGAYGHEQGWTPAAGDIEKGAAIGGGLGAAAGTLSGVVGRGGTPPTSPTADDLEAAAKQAYAPLSNILYDAKSEVHPALDVTTAQNALRDWSGYKWNDASKTAGEIKTLLDKPQLSANDLQQSQSYLKGIAAKPTSDPNDQLYAGYYAKKLQDVLENGVPQTGVPQGAGPGYAAAVKADGDVLHGQAQDMRRLETMQAKAAVTGGPDVSNQARSFLTSDQGRAFAPQGSPQYQAWNNLAGTASPDIAAAPSAWDIRHFAHPLVGAGMGAAFGAEQGHSPSTIAEEAATGAALGWGLHRGYPALTAKFVQGPAQQRAVDALGSTLSTGNYVAPLGANAPVRAALRTLLLNQGNRGAY